jgi:hypothetical protein
MAFYHLRRQDLARRSRPPQPYVFELCAAGVHCYNDSRRICGTAVPVPVNQTKFISRFEGTFYGFCPRGQYSVTDP